MLGEAFFLSGLLEKARAAGAQALEASTEIGYSLAIGWAHQVIGRVAQAEGAMGEVGRHLTEALQSFVSIGARSEMSISF